jgi:hypothetical protein
MAICERPELCTQRNNTIGMPSAAFPSTRASAVSRRRANRSASSGRKLGTVAWSGELVERRVQEPFDRLRTEDSVELLRQPLRRGCQGQRLVDVQVGSPVGLGHDVLASSGRTTGATRLTRSANMA